MKFQREFPDVKSALSPYLRGRGLKYTGTVADVGKTVVALFTRAWIEIERLTFISRTPTRRPLYEGVD